MHPHAFVLWVVAAAVSSGAVHAQSDVLRPRDFKIDLVTGPIIGPNSTLALGGAYTALGFGIDAAALTPAAYATRTLWETHWFELDVTAGYSPGSFQSTDFDNNGEAGFSYRDYHSLTGGARFTFGEIGFGGLVRAQNYRVGARASVNLIIANYGAGYSLLDGQLLVAAAGRTAVLDLVRLAGDRTTLAQFSGTGPELGIVLALADQPYRIGFAARTAIEAIESDETGVAGGFVFPRALVLPAEFQAGFAYQFGSRPLNRRWVNPHDVANRLREAMLARRRERQREQLARERAHERLLRSLDTAPPLMAADPLEELTQPRDPEFWQRELARRPAEELALEREVEAAQAQLTHDVRALPRKYLLLSVDAILIAPIEDGIGFESFLSQRREASGREVSWGLRFGAEGEPIERRLKLRVGTYFEPSRFAAGTTRVHATFGTDVKLFEWDVLGLIDPIELRVGGAIDLAVRYLNYGISVGVWR